MDLTPPSRRPRQAEPPAGVNADYLLKGVAFTPMAVAAMVRYVERSPLESRGALLGTVTETGELLVGLVTGSGKDAVQEWGYTNWTDLDEVRAVIDHLADIFSLGLGGLFHGHPAGASTHYSETDLATMRFWTTDDDFNLRAAAFPILRRDTAGRVCDMTVWYLERGMEQPVAFPWRLLSADDPMTARWCGLAGDSPILAAAPAGLREAELRAVALTAPLGPWSEERPDEAAAGLADLSFRLRQHGLLLTADDLGAGTLLLQVYRGRRVRACALYHSETDSLQVCSGSWPNSRALLKAPRERADGAEVLALLALTRRGRRRARKGDASARLVPGGDHVHVLLRESAGR